MFCKHTDTCCYFLMWFWNWHTLQYWRFIRTFDKQLHLYWRLMCLTEDILWSYQYFDNWQCKLCWWGLCCRLIAGVWGKINLSFTQPLVKTFLVYLVISHKHKGNSSIFLMPTALTVRWAKYICMCIMLTNQQPLSGQICDSNPPSHMHSVTPKQAMSWQSS